MMEEKLRPVPNEGHRRRQKQRRRRFPWGSIATVILVVAVCVYGRIRLPHAEKAAAAL
ncbi:MAG: hypothetical protein UD575_14200 [Oscillospiraceae bacterium]|nr:hypothetical protein [Oscillospiraceae bacterium]